MPDNHATTQSTLCSVTSPSNVSAKLLITAEPISIMIKILRVMVAG